MNATVVHARLHATIQRTINVTARRDLLERLIHESNQPVRFLYGQPARVNFFTQTHRLAAIVVAEKITASETSKVRVAENIVIIEAAEIRVASRSPCDPSRPGSTSATARPHRLR